MSDPTCPAERQSQDINGFDAHMESANTSEVSSALEKIFRVMNELTELLEEQKKELRMDIEELKTRWRGIEERLDLQYNTFRYTSPTPSESVSQVGRPTSSKSSTITFTSSTSGSSPVEALPEQPIIRPDEYPESVLWTLADAWEDPLAQISADNKYQPSMRKCVRNKDGSILTNSQWRSIRSSLTIVFVKHLLPLANSTSPAPSNKTLNKTFYTTYHKAVWKKAVNELGLREPLLHLCANNWKAEHALSRKLESMALKTRRKGIRKGKLDKDGKDGESTGDGEDGDSEENEPHVVAIVGKRPADPVETSSVRVFQKRKTSYTHSNQPNNQQSSASVEHQRPQVSSVPQRPLPSLIGSISSKRDQLPESFESPQLVSEGSSDAANEVNAKPDVAAISKAIAPPRDAIIDNSVDYSYTEAEPTYETLHYCRTQKLAKRRIRQRDERESTC